jgi:hypothetical protein
MALIHLPACFRGCYSSLVVPRIFLVFLVFTTALACNRKAKDGRGLLPPAPAGQATSAVASPAPFDQTLGTAAFARTVFRTAGPASLEVTIRDVIIGPHAEAQLPLPAGPVVIDTRSGAGTASAGTKTADLSMQQPASFPAGTPIALKNGEGTPLVLRLYLLEGK